MREKTKVRFLTVVWGERYVADFCSLTLPSFLAQGNLPTIAAGADLEVVIMTTTDSIKFFKRQPAFLKLETVCPVRMVPIDDLATPANYGVALTLAYTRGIALSGEDQTSTYFVFMNSDFVLADGGGKTLLKLFDEGHPCIMSASLRACSEEVLPVLEARVDRDEHVFAMQSRELVDLALRNLHPTVVGKMVTQSFLRSSSHNHLYWKVDDDTMLGRNHLIFMLAIRPEVRIESMNSYCDYGFVPEFVPSGRIHVIGDSDDFFMLELAPVDQERNILRCGEARPADIAKELERWTTREHRVFAQSDTVFHSGDLPASLPAVRSEADRYVRDIQKRMSEPVDHADHIYWVLGLEAWNYHRHVGRKDDEKLDMPSEVRPLGAVKLEPRRFGMPVQFKRPTVRPLLDRAKVMIARSYLRLGQRYVGMRGSFPNFSIFHAEWRNGRLLRDWAAAQPASANVLMLGGEDVRGLGKIGAELGAKVMSLREFHALRPGERQYDTIVLHVLRQDVRSVADTLARASNMITPQGSMVVFVEHANAARDPSNFSYELAGYVDSFLPRDLLGYDVRALFMGGKLIRTVTRMEHLMVKRLWPTGWSHVLSFLGAVLLWPVLVGLTALLNLTSSRPTSDCPDYCTAALVTFKRTSTRAQQRVEAMPELRKRVKTRRKAAPTVDKPDREANAKPAKAATKAAATPAKPKSAPKPRKSRAKTA